jgi:flagellar biosynthesis protein FlhB
VALTRDEHGERTEMPTALRLEEARRIGHVARSSDVVAVAATAGALAGLWLFGREMLDALVKLVGSQLATPAGDVRRAAAGAGLDVWPVARAALAMVALPLAAAIVANLAQTGFVYAGELVRPRMQRISPGAGFRRMFGKRAIVGLIVSVLKVAVVGGAVAMSFGGAVTRAAGASLAGPEAILGICGGVVLGAACRLLLALAAVALLDLLYQRWQYLQDLKITRRELLDDIRQMSSRRTPSLRRRKSGRSEGK